MPDGIIRAKKHSPCTSMTFWWDQHYEGIDGKRPQTYITCGRLVLAFVHHASFVPRLLCRSLSPFAGRSPRSRCPVWLTCRWLLAFTGTSGCQHKQQNSFGSADGKMPQLRWLSRCATGLVECHSSHLPILANVEAACCQKTISAGRTSVSLSEYLIVNTPSS
jgi:hypothetical protein